MEGTGQEWEEGMHAQQGKEGGSFKLHYIIVWEFDVVKPHKPTWFTNCDQESLPCLEPCLQVFLLISFGA